MIVLNDKKIVLINKKKVLTIHSKCGMLDT